ncbi:carbon-nitrogen family hydrolase [Halobacillus halophilus]|uniref:Carbon-nitrogen hydrolase family protein n=1 Tax=Halobacillus halophilus (strain ATCC 35676 / DSM 2266 / JCM 20832 / KCTC 3685 / LMG 17431 / NBRC 102448 / NCIMB 2269) TaxID=866895 RepID=I0JHT9_HALH3|nr:carbon-nitrogen family hydrolase [Halobacillus halophilus]ASF37912.1 carbon-nitrogen family hydrolase [Halobacillus halophilus]CCG43707.1 carbon-nitrogen hydrolase family protein [Halobacillus halophilus DSM 2266]
MTVKAGIIQMDVAFGDPEANRTHATQKIEEAARNGSEIIVLPELWTTGYDLSRFDELAESMDGPTHQMLMNLSSKHRVTILGSIAEREEGRFYNTFVAYNSMGERIAKYRKAHLFRLMNEEKHLHSGNQKGNFELNGVPAAGVICYDIRFPEWMRTHMLNGSRALFVVAEWPKPRVDHWRNLLISRAIENQCFVIACNRVGSDAANTFGGHSIIVDPWGNVVAEGSGDEEILYGEVDFTDVEAIREQIPIFQDRRPDLYE